MKGSIRCNACDVALDEKRGACPKCGRASCYIALYWKGKTFRYYQTAGGIVHGYASAVDQLIHMNREMREGRFNPTRWLPRNCKGRLLRNAIHLWLADKEREVSVGELSPGTLHAYRSYTRRFYVPLLGDKDVQQIDFAALKRFKDQLAGKIKYRRNVLNALHAFFEWARRTEDEYIREVPPFPEIKGSDATPRIALTYEEQVEGLAKIPEVHRDVLEFGFETGLRPGETAALKIWDVKVSTREALIQRTWTMSKLKETTKESSKKLIPLSDKAFEIAMRQIRSRDGGDWLFVNPATGRHYTVQGLNNIWRRFSGFDCTHYEASRHSFCTQIVEQGTPLHEAKELMRHADLRSTEHYLHARTERLRKHCNRRGKVVHLRAVEGDSYGNRAGEEK